MEFQDTSCKNLCWMLLQETFSGLVESTRQCTNYTRRWLFSSVFESHNWEMWWKNGDFARISNFCSPVMIFSTPPIYSKSSTRSVKCFIAPGKVSADENYVAFSGCRTSKTNSCSKRVALASDSVRSLNTHSDMLIVGMNTFVEGRYFCLFMRSRRTSVWTRVPYNLLGMQMLNVIMVQNWGAHSF